jgi:hypothetical protein
LFPILPQCDSFLIIVFPVSLAGIFRHMSIEWRIAKKRCIAALNSHLLLGVNAGINGRNDSFDTSGSAAKCESRSPQSPSV